MQVYLSDAAKLRAYMTKTTVESLKPGDVIMPPTREVSLWMRRTLQERGLPESALYLTVTGIDEGNPDKGGRWLIVSADQTAEWLDGRKPSPFRFKARPTSPWPLAARA